MASPTASKTNILDLPLEVRNMIYELCLCVNGHITPYKEKLHAIRDVHNIRDGAARQTPTVALLATNKQIRDEALPELFGRNRWAIAGHALIAFLEGGESIWRLHRMLFRDVIVHCDQWDVDQNKYVNTKRQAKKLPISDQWIQEANIHRDGYDSICRSLSWKVDVVMAMPHLRSFTVDARWLCFPMCCCRIAMLRTLVKLIVAQWGTILVRPKTAMPSWRVIFVGIYDQAEEAEIRRLDKVDPPVPWELSVKA